MDSERFDALLRTLSSGTSRRGALGMLAGLAGLGLSEVAAKRRHQGGHRQGKGKGKAASQDKVTICHRTGSKKHPFQVITVPASAVPAHKAHGDLVDCPNLQVIDVETRTCVFLVGDIACETGQELDPMTCACVSQSDVCVPGQCDSLNTACQTCHCNRGGGCVCSLVRCQTGTCDPVTGCPS